MRVFHVPEDFSDVYKDGVMMLPDLELDVLSDDSLESMPEDDFLMGIDDWWAEFTADMNL
ncbi:hypothetical protein TheveDRAFT_0801 [Thermanaerovibrio velox DSM 12556]|uniref:Uncharacterized protein n=1 Tax=Thermanaerovibrio velox DSM 12556 TaxID=926567 RepID=H0URL1_9BACT|nr:hypothetical protein [Thermanaerovibrio velox]EHM09950.1 hypothetical protein TheveDRAFT_0801 [Thermanaerovibrio velox DSM 12556]